MYHRKKKALFERTSEQEKHVSHFPDSCIVKPEETVLEFLDQQSIIEERNRENRADIYRQATKTLSEIVETCSEYGIVTQQLEDTAFNSDYTAMEKANNTFDDAFEMDEPRDTKLQALQTNFTDFFHRQLSINKLISERIEYETLDVIGKPIVSRIDKSFLGLFQSCLAPER